MQPQRLLVDGRDVARDDAAFLEQFDPAMAGRHRQPDLIGQLLHGQPAVVLEVAEDFSVDGVECGHWDEPVVFTDRLVRYPNMGWYCAKN